MLVGAALGGALLLLGSSSALAQAGSAVPKPPAVETEPAPPSPAPHVPAHSPSAAPRPAATPSATSHAAPVASAPVAPSAAPLPSALEPLPSASAGPEPAPPLASVDAPAPAPSAAPAPLASAHPPEPAPAPAPSAAPPPARHDAFVLIGDDKVFAVRAPLAGRTAEQRAQAASTALGAASEQPASEDVRIERKGELAVIIAGATPVISLGLDDALAVGDASLDVHAASVASAVKSAIERDHRKRALSQTVFAVSLIVFLGLIAFYLIQKIGEFGERFRKWIDEHGETVLAIRVRQIEVVSPGTVRSTALVGLSVARWLAQLGVFYAWVMVGLSFFEATRGYTGKVTGLIVAPLSQLMTRLATGLPVLAVLVIAGFVVFVLVRFIGLFFDSIERRENVVSWIAPELAAPTGALLRVGVVLSALVYLAPLVTGTTEGTLGRTGAVALVALGLAATPLLASGILGAVVLYGRRLRAGQHVEIGAHAGRIASIGLLDLRLEDDDRAEVRIPHLYCLRHPTRVLGLRARIGVEVAVGPEAKHTDVQGILLRVASRFGDDARVELVSADAERTLFRISFASEQRNARSELQLAIFEALASAHVPLGRLGSRGADS